MKQFNAVLRLRRDNDYNYKKIAETFIPANGEICLIDTARDGLQAVCGDGVTPFSQLEYLYQLVKRGYFINSLFYKDNEGAQELTKQLNVIYIDLLSHKLYYYDGEKYQIIDSNEIKSASSTEAGIMKLYTTTGFNSDGTMTQKAITDEFISVRDYVEDELDDKVEASVNLAEELLIFTN